MLKNYVGISRDHSASMGTIARAAARDYNDLIAALREGAAEEKIDTIVSVVKCGVYGYGRTENKFDTINSNVMVLSPIQESSYEATGRNTPLFDSVNMLIEQLQEVPDASDPNVSFVVMVVTDGEDNASKLSGRTLGDMIRRLQATDRWTFVFRVPRGAKYRLVGFGIPEGNILEWEQTTKGMEESTRITASAVRSFYSARNAGVTNTNTFYANMSGVSKKEIKKALKDVSGEVTVYMVEANNHGVQIRDFVEAQGFTYNKGCAFYELSKPEKVQEYKRIAIRDKSTGAVYSGDNARDLLGLPHYGDIKLTPGAHGNYEIFVQSTSVNRKLVEGTNLMIWPISGL